MRNNHVNPYQPGPRKPKKATGRPKSENRELALITGEMTYNGSVHAKCGTTERYVSGGSCVHCARAIATEQREARLRLKAQESIEEYAQSFVTEDGEQHEVEINHVETEEENTIDVDERSDYEKSIDDLM